MTLKDRLTGLIRADGPLSVATFMQLCLHDPKQGYYTTRPGLGQDFITAPEISQIFGELLGLWAAHEWQIMGRPARLTLCEIGPGRGTLMGDALRAARTVAGFEAALDLHFIEASPKLRDNLKAQFGEHVTFCQDLPQLPDSAPLIILANEWLDCLPARQFVQVGQDWHERVVGLGQDGQLQFGLTPSETPEQPARVNDVTKALEVQVGLETLVSAIGDLFNRLKQTGHPARFLCIDYGPANQTPGDTLRAYAGGKQVDPLSAPGETDLTVDVDFARLRRLAEAGDLTCHGPKPQGQFLGTLGIEARLQALIKATPDAAETLFAGAQRLVDPGQMGTRFQALCLSTHGLQPPAGFEPH
ncbi:MAG: SAM-dependent methyltransferase [Pseudomonadota bacterium]